MVNNTDLTPDFGIEIQFDSTKVNPSKAFRTLSEILEALHSVDEDLVNSIDSKIKPITVLEDLKKGSIKGWFKNTLESIPDDGLKDLDWKKAVGSYLVKGKYAIIKFLDGKTEISSREQIKELEDGLYKLAEETDVKRIPSYSPIPTAKLIGGIRRISDSLKYVDEGGKVIFATSEQKRVDFNLEFNFSPESIEDLLTKESISNKTEMILKVKKPDYLGDSQWELRHEKIPIYAKIIDIEWLRKFQAREINVRPGDSLKANVKITVNYDYNNEVIGTHYEILKVKDIIQADNSNQLEIPINVNGTT
ncbi:MAG: hypothetical protein HYV37_03410 [Candidatus Levyibacteriota bacterium]|nr:MAG: hypothetical protein HYV37_03410 [Candidatus Levybacteria bacterium]